MPYQNSLQSTGKHFEAELSAQFSGLLQDADVNEQVSKTISEWQSSTDKHVHENNPFIEMHRVLTQAERDFKAHGGDVESISADLAAIGDNTPDFDICFWQEKLNSSLDLDTLLKSEKFSKKTKKSTQVESYDTLRRNLLEAWRHEYQRKLLAWQLEQIEIRRKKLFEQLQSWLEKILALKVALEGLGIGIGIGTGTGAGAGLLWDTSVGNLSRQDISTLTQWAERIKNDPNLKNLCELIGRMRKEQKSYRFETIQRSIQYQQITPDIHSNEEIVGIELGNDLERVLPQELSLLSDPDTALLFDLKFIENRLMCFSKQGNALTSHEKIIEEQVSIEEEDKKGPIILCIDTSGSMSGAPEYVAKAIALTLATQAAAQKRDCYLINFSTRIETLNLSPPQTLANLIDFLMMSFHGGTDVAPALLQGLRMMQSEQYKKADLLVISDFILDGLSDAIVQQCNLQKEQKSRFFSLAIGSFRIQNISEIFDQEWTYNPRTGSISELNNVVEWMNK